MRLIDIPDSAERGQGCRAYQTRCARCNDLGLDRAPQRPVLALMSPQSIHRSRAQGGMAQHAKELSDADRLAVMEFIAIGRKDAAGPAVEPPRLHRRSNDIPDYP